MSLFRSGIAIASFTFISRIFGLLRELFIAAIFGSSSNADSINVAFKLPNLFRRIFAEGALSSIFVPIYNDKAAACEEEAKIFTGKIFSLLIITLIGLVALIQIFMPLLMFIIAPGFHLDLPKFELTVFLCRITMPYLIFISMAALIAGVLGSKRQFAAFAFSPVILNLIVIIFTILSENLLSNVTAVALSILIAGILQAAFMFFCAFRARLLFPIKIDIHDKDVRKLLINMIPASISSGAMQLNIFISQSIASFVPGAVSILSYADRIYQFPLSIIGITFGTILLPELSKIYKLNDYEKANRLQNRAIKIAILLSLPASLGIILLAGPIIHIIYERGAFNAIDTHLTSRAISAFALGLPAFILAKILVPIFFANHDTKTPLKITLYSLVVNAGLNLALMREFGATGIALASSIAAWYNVYLLNKFAGKRMQFKISLAVRKFSLKVVLNCFVMALIIWALNYFLNDLYYNDSSLIKALALFANILIAMLCYSLGCIYFGLHKILLNKI